MKIHYSIAVSSPEQLAELPVLKKVDFAEISSQMRGWGDFYVPSAWENRIHRMSFRAETRTINALVDAGAAMSRDFFRMFSAGCADCAIAGLQEISLGIDWESALSDAAYAKKLREILGCCFGIAVKYGLTVFLEVRVPGVAACQPLDFIRFRDSLLFPVRTLVDFYPHEPGALELMESFSGKLPFEVNKFRVSFDAAGGNYLSPRLLEKIKSFLHPVGCEKTELCFCPGRVADKAAFSALETVIV